MATRTLVRLATALFAVVILFYSLIETSTVHYAFGAKDIEPTASPQDIHVEYELPYPGTINPGSPFWPAKALRDRIGMEMNRDSLGRAEYELHLADKRLSAGWELWSEGHTNDALATFDRAEKYLQKAFDDISEQEDSPRYRNILRLMSYSSLKHREVLEQVMTECGDEARPMVNKTLDISKDIFVKSTAKMTDLQMSTPENPF